MFILFCGNMIIMRIWERFIVIFVFVFIDFLYDKDKIRLLILRLEVMC